MYWQRVVTPFAGVWIEIISDWENNKNKPSLPSRECGLKFVNLYCHLFPTLVTPFAGVWIEIEDIEKMVKTTLVTPFAGVWIEITSLSHFVIGRSGHSLRGSVD